jgi:hypothetical protein
VRWVAGECFEVEIFREKNIYKDMQRKYVNIYIHGTRQDKDKEDFTLRTLSFS